MTRPLSDRMRQALTDYAKLTDDGRYAERVSDIAHRYQMSQPALSRAARKAGLSRYLTNR